MPSVTLLVDIGLILRRPRWRRFVARALAAAASIVPAACYVSTAPPRPVSVVHTPAGPHGVYVVDRLSAAPAPYIPDRVGIEVLSTGARVDVVRYVHVYPDSIESYPRVWWAGRWYYNVGGNLVFWDPFYGGWSFYWGPPNGLVTVWNSDYPRRRYVRGVGYYGRGWYWGGVGPRGWHAYAEPPRYYRRDRPYRQPRQARYIEAAPPRRTAPPATLRGERPRQSPPQRAQRPRQSPPQRAQRPRQSPPQRAQRPRQSPPQRAQRPRQSPPQRAERPRQSPPQRAQRPRQSPPQRAQRPRDNPSQGRARKER